MLALPAVLGFRKLGAIESPTWMNDDSDSAEDELTASIPQRIGKRARRASALLRMRFPTLARRLKQRKHSIKQPRKPDLPSSRNRL
ncbi:MAG: hypothetical protein K2X93_00540 [Candidatus Obscuribacterales bacterium]|nr:hypothetical protein [Candidatus Obscuribacterales bacterium]